MLWSLNRTIKCHNTQRSIMETFIHDDINVIIVYKRILHSLWLFQISILSQIKSIFSPESFMRRALQPKMCLFKYHP